MAVNTDDLAVYPLAVLGCQEADNTGDIDGKANTAERRPRGGVLRS